MGHGDLSSLGARPGARKVALIQIGRGGQPSCAVELEPSFRTTLIRVGCRRTRSGLSCAHQAQTVPSVFPRHLTRPDDEAAICRCRCGEEQDDRATGSSPRSARSAAAGSACVEGIFDYRTGEVPVLLHASAPRAASSNGVSSSGNSFRIRSSRAIVGLRSPSTSGRATDAHRRDKVQPERGE